MAIQPVHRVVFDIGRMVRVSRDVCMYVDGGDDEGIGKGFGLFRIGKSVRLRLRALLGCDVPRSAML
jgi:hypothetical protein